MISYPNFSQVNTEAIRDAEIKQGFRSKLDFLFGLNSGNSEFISFASNVRVDYIEEDFRTFIAGNIDFKRGNTNEITNKGFLHARFIFKTSKYYQPELFLQEEFNEFVLLNDRSLAGAGVRFLITESKFKKDTSAKFDVYLGIGGMLEYENLSTTPRTITRIARSTNYLTITWQPLESFAFNSVTYFQVDVTRLRDHRVLNETQLQFNLTEVLKFNVGLSYRYDREPPASIKQYDLELKNGITLEF